MRSRKKIFKKNLQKKNSNKKNEDKFFFININPSKFGPNFKNLSKQKKKKKLKSKEHELNLMEKKRVKSLNKTIL
jgi:hypothetical protein